MDGSRIRKEKVADSKISGYVWTGPKCPNKFDRLIKEMLFIRKFKPSLNVQTDSIRAKVFT